LDAKEQRMLEDNNRRSSPIRDRAPFGRTAFSRLDARLDARVLARRADIVVALAIMTLALPARAQKDIDAAEKLVRRGVELRKAGHDEEALEAFRSAFQTTPNPRAQAQMGLAEHALGHWVDAERNLNGALQAERDPWITKNAAALRQSLTAVGQHLGSLHITGTPPGARVVVDEREMGRLPFTAPVRVPAGEILVTVSAPGFIDISRKLTVGTGGLVRDTFTLHRVAPPERAVVAIEPRTSENAHAAPPDQPESAPPTETPPDDRGSKDTARPGLSTAQSWAIAIGAAGVAALGVATVFTLQAISKNNASHPGCQGDTCDPVGAAYRREALTAGDRATAAFVVGGVLLSGGLVLFIMGRPSSTSSSAMRLVPVIEPGRMALVGTMRF
jgi:hypothetical protein